MISSIGPGRCRSASELWVTCPHVCCDPSSTDGGFVACNKASPQTKPAPQFSEARTQPLTVCRDRPRPAPRAGRSSVMRRRVLKSGPVAAPPRHKFGVEVDLIHRRCENRQKKREAANARIRPWPGTPCHEWHGVSFDAPLFTQA